MKCTANSTIVVVAARIHIKMHARLLNRYYVQPLLGYMAIECLTLLQFCL